MNKLDTLFENMMFPIGTFLLYIFNFSLKTLVKFAVNNITIDFDQRNKMQ